MIDNAELKARLSDITYWNKSAERLLLKPKLTLEDKMTIADTIADKEKYIDLFMNGAYAWSIPKKVLIAKPGSTKKRTVYIFSIRDRLFLGVLYRVLSDCTGYAKFSNCYSYKTGISTVGAVKVLKAGLEEGMHGVKLDIHAYFNSVSYDRLVEMLNELFEGTVLFSMQCLFLNEFIEYKGKIETEYKGMLPGSAIASFFANYCLSPLDKYFEEHNILYARYSDDIIILDKAKEKLNEYIEVVNKYIKEYGLEINPDKYAWFTPDDSYFNFLGLKFNDDVIDISDHSKQKIKKQIHRWCRKGRLQIEREGKSFDKVAKQIIRRLNYKNFKCYIENENTFGWCHYAFRYINTIDTLKEIDFYTKDTLRAMKTGKHNKANVKALSDQEIIDLGWVSLIDLYNLYHKDFDYYCEIIDLL